MRQSLDSLASLGKVVLIWGVIILGIPYLIGCAYVNFIQPRQEASQAPPSIEKAQFVIIQERTGNVIAYADKVNQEGSVIVLDNWFTRRNNSYRLHKDEFTLDEKDWGNILVRRR